MFSIPITISAATGAYIGKRVRDQKLHDRRMHEVFEHRIHVNGIRGKSSVTRLIAAALREGGINTLAKTTGTAARIITDHQTDIKVNRKEADIAEQKRILTEYIDQNYSAAVFECMAINPVYQKYLENRIMFSTIGVITNIREDHTDVLGKTLPEIAKSLASTVPKNGYLVTAETDKKLLDILEKVCVERNTKLYSTKRMRISDADMAKFHHFEYKSNVAIAIKIAQLVGVSRKKALAGMYKALPDPGAFVIKEFKARRKTIHWANLFAINDRESFVMTVESLCNIMGDKTKKAIILNNRHDRPERVLQFVDIAVNSVGADYILTFGDYEEQAIKAIEKFDAAKKIKVISMGNTSKYSDYSGEELFDEIANELSDNTILLGAVNIHTPQAVALLEKLEPNYGH